MPLLNCNARGDHGEGCQFNYRAGDAPGDGLSGEFRGLAPESAQRHPGDIEIFVKIHSGGGTYWVWKVINLYGCPTDVARKILNREFDQEFAGPAIERLP